MQEKDLLERTLVRWTLHLLARAVPRRPHGLHERGLLVGEFQFVLDALIPVLEDLCCYIRLE
jgi:hypothetical protein